MYLLRLLVGDQCFRNAYFIVVQEERRDEEKGRDRGREERDS